MENVASKLETSKVLRQGYIKRRFEKEVLFNQGFFQEFRVGDGVGGGGMGREGMRVAKLSWKWFGEIWS